MALASSIILQYLQRKAHLEKLAFKQKTLLKMMSYGGTFGIISAYTGATKSGNKERQGELIADLQRAGYRRIVPLKGSWEGKAEQTIMIPMIEPKLLFELGRKYEQDAVIYKSKDGVVGMYYTKGTPRAEVAVDPQGDPVFEMAGDDSLYTKTRNLSFQFGFLLGQEIPWNGVQPIARKQLRSLVQRQRVQEDPLVV